MSKCHHHHKIYIAPITLRPEVQFNVNVGALNRSDGTVYVVTALSALSSSSHVLVLTRNGQ